MLAERITGPRDVVFSLAKATRSFTRCQVYAKGVCESIVPPPSRPEHFGLRPWLEAGETGRPTSKGSSGPHLPNPQVTVTPYAMSTVVQAVDPAGRRPKIHRYTAFQRRIATFPCLEATFVALGMESAAERRHVEGAGNDLTV